MTAAILAQLAAAKAAPVAPRHSGGPGIRPAAVRGVAVPKTTARETAKEQPGPKADTPLRYAFAGPLHAEQFPGEFRVVVTGAMPQLPVLLAALNNLARLQKDYPTLPTP